MAPRVLLPLIRYTSRVSEAAAGIETTGKLDKSGRTIRDMFAGVAPRYDLLNHLLSANLDVIWRKKATAVLGLPPGAEVLDLC